MITQVPEPATAMSVGRTHLPGLHICAVTRRDFTELHLTLLPLPGESARMLSRRLNACLRAHNASVVHHEFFAAAEHFSGHEHEDEIWDWPVTILKGGSCPGGKIAGMHVFAVSGTPVETIHLGNRIVGRTYRDPFARHCLLSGILPNDLAAPPPVQARQVFDAIQSAVCEAEMSLRNLFRTWLFVDDILGWYDQLNKVRRDFFQEHRIFDYLVPASTGIGVRNPDGAAIVAGAWAMEPLDSRCFAAEIPSPMQCPAPQYGSCFSRAVELVSPDLRRVLVSGTASIEPRGSSVCAGDIDGQIDLTMQVVRAILVSRGMDYPDVTRATAYLRRPEDAALFQRWRAKLGIEDWPLVVTQSVVCRDELLFEIELDALAPAGR